MPESVHKIAEDIVSAARSEFVSWSTVSVSERRALLRSLRKTIATRRSEICSRVSESVRKTEAEVLVLEIFPVILFIKWLERNLTSVLKRRKVDIPIEMFGRKAWVEYRPSGTALIISPWNFPFFLSMVPAISAAAGGNTVIIKPSEYADGTGSLLVDLFVKAGFPKDVVQVAEGGADMAQSLMDLPLSRISFTGSIKTGKIIAAKAGEKLIPCVTELGGISAMIVFADADLERAVNGALFSAFAGCGQICVASKRIYVQDTIYERFTDMLVAKAKDLSQGSLQSGDLGYIRLPKHYVYLNDLIKDAVSKGAEIMCGEIGEESFSPVILKGVPQDARIMKEEAFGPVLPIASFDGSVSEAVRLANDTDTGLSASVWTGDKHKAQDTLKQLRAGLLSINEAITGPAIPALPFGGVKQSGIGRSHGVEGVRFFMDEISCTSFFGKIKKEFFWFRYGDEYTKSLKDVMSFYAKEKSVSGILKAAFSLVKRIKG